MTDKIERYEPYTDEGNREGYGNMEPYPEGDWVSFDDYVALAAERGALQAKLEKAVEALKHIEHFDIHAPTHARNTLAELKDT